MRTKFIHTYVSVDCVVFGFENNQFSILLVQLDKEKIGNKNLKLPGGLIYDHEDVDMAALRILYELTGIKRMTMRQFRCFSSPDRASHPDDIHWMDRAYQPNIDRLITVSYLSLCKIDKKLKNVSRFKSTKWCRLNELPAMPFDHNQIVDASFLEIRRWVEHDPAMMFELLPQKFTFSQFHALYEAVYNRKIDPRNFYKKVKNMAYVVPLEEKQTQVAHRAAGYYKFDKVTYNKWKMGI
ncbi:MAG: NUDIX hydrolase [Tannerella sp.]|nr:NUDIX hydrolase [Tannerella sp.]